jgi:hypothetical protein
LGLKLTYVGRMGSREKRSLYLTIHSVSDAMVAD